MHRKPSRVSLLFLGLALGLGLSVLLDGWFLRLLFAISFAALALLLIHCPDRC